MSYERCFSEVRSLLQGESSRQAFLTICAQVEQAAMLDLDACVAELIPYAQEALKAWPSAIKMAPMLWINRLIHEALPLEALHLCSALSLLAAMTKDHWTDQNQRLFEWLEALPEDSPALEGLSIGRGDVMCQALAAAIEQAPDRRFHPQATMSHLSVQAVDPIDMESEQLELVFGSPLCRHLRVLDASWDAHVKFPGRDDLYRGRGLSLHDVAFLTGSDRLEAIDLHGQRQDVSPLVTFKYLGPPERAKLKGLKALDVGGGFPLGDASITELVQACPALEQLNLSPGTLTAFIFDEGFSWETSWQAQEAYELGISDDDHAKKCSLSDKGLARLNQLKSLQLLQLGRLLPELIKPFEARGVTLSTGYSLRAGALWARYFEL